VTVLRTWELTLGGSDGIFVGETTGDPLPFLQETCLHCDCGAVADGEGAYDTRGDQNFFSKLYCIRTIGSRWKLLRSKTLEVYPRLQGD